jgi:predicted MFS family arabinose efflux permease
MGGYLVDNLSWRAAFLLHVPLAIAIVLITLRHVPESLDLDAGKLDVPGAVLGHGGAWRDRLQPDRILPGWLR